ncbi:MAG: DUF3179 domain-containing protein [Bacteroidales bacterium]|nr:DUF3179 domain-containing protein [Bacteroidales bacterium]MDT8430113.1 DUF3179 domain-containing protein [Bacteroidales bacterium]
MSKNISFTLAILSLLSITTMAQKNPKNLDVDWKTDLSNHAVPLKEFTVLLEPDGIPPIDDPKFWDWEKAAENFFTHEPVIAVEVNGQARAYPLSILTYHEIVNDRVGGQPISVTYCPLCNAALVFDRQLSFNGKDYLLDFGVSGMLRNSDLVMWDRQTESWWQQFTGTALVGDLTGATLDIISSMLISLEEFFDTYPGGKVLSTETGHFRNYGTNPYTGYDDLENTQPRLFDGEVDARLPAMERVIDVHVKGKYKVYPLSGISREGVINDTFNGQSLVLFYTSKTVSVLDESEIAASRKVGSVTVFVPEVKDRQLTFIKEGEHFKDTQTSSIWSITGKCISGPMKGQALWPVTHGNHFAFAWFTFHPDSEIYGQ